MTPDLQCSNLPPALTTLVALKLKGEGCRASSSDRHWANAQTGALTNASGPIAGVRPVWQAAEYGLAKRVEGCPLSTKVVQ